jgi:hypothetical protein
MDFLVALAGLIFCDLPSALFLCTSVYQAIGLTFDAWEIIIW